MPSFKVLLAMQISSLTGVPSFNASYEPIREISGVLLTPKEN